MLAVTAFFSLLIAALIVVFAIKYRRRHKDEVGVANHGSLALELLWTVIPFLITMVMFGWGAKVFFDIYRPPAGAMEIYVVGKQWMWKAQHMDGQREINELHVPVGRPVKLIMGSEDVIHSFFIPAFRVKADVIPGRYNVLWFTATQAGPVSPVLRRVLRHEALRHGRVGRRDGAECVPGVAGRRQRVRLARRGRRRNCSRTWRARRCHRGDAQAQAPRLEGVFGSTVQLQGGAHGRRRRGVHPRVDRQPAGEDRRRLPADHADVPGAGQRKSSCCSSSPTCDRSTPSRVAGIARASVTDDAAEQRRPAREPGK